MTVPVEEPSESPAAPVTTVPDLAPVRPKIEDLCPYLISSSGAWRSATPNRAHRCGAVEPPTLLTPDKQRRLCLTPDHALCTVYSAARASRAAMLAPGLDPSVVAAADAARRPVGRTTAVILEHPRLSLPQTRWPVDRALSQAALVALMIVAFVALAVARLSGPDAGVTAPTPSASPSAPVASPSPTRRPTPRPTASPAASPSVGASPSAAAATAQPSFRTYRVKSGDTLGGIAATFRTTVAEIMRLNGITNSRSLKIGQVLKIP